jgi:hypothetical protein
MSDQVFHERDAYNNIGAIIAGVDEDFDDDDGDGMVSGDEDIDQVLGAALRLSNPRQFLSRVARTRVRPQALRRPGGRAVSRLAKISRQVLIQTGRIEAEYMRRPNTLVSIYTPALAPGASVAFSINPGQGNNYYRLLGQICTDAQANVFGYSNLTVGGQNHVQFAQNAPVAPVANAVPWAIFQLKEGKLVTNIAPWTGQIFDNSTPVTGTIVNMTTAAATDATTAAARIVVLTQTDPCSYRSNLALDAQRGWLRNNKRDLQIFAPLFVR